TTALIMIDLIKQTCNDQRRPRCVASIPKIEKLLAAARANGVTVIYTLFPSPSPATFPNPVIGDYVPAVAPKGDEPVVTSFVDKFIDGDKDIGLQKLLNDKGITTVVPVGATSHNGVPPPHSITSSARSSIDSGIVKSIDLAALRLIVSRYFVGC